jgi:uncharacterized membrane protein YdbT with pleckstrin-like domain
MITPSEILTKDEKVELSLKPDFVATFLPVGFIAVFIFIANVLLFLNSSNTPIMFKFSLVVLSVSVIGFIVAVAGVYLRYIYTYYFVTNRRIIYQSGVVSRDHRDCRLERIQNIYVEISFLDRILNVGNILISTAGEIGIEVTLSRVRNPIEIKRQINEILDRLITNHPPSTPGV